MNTSNKTSIASIIANGEIICFNEQMPTEIINTKKFISKSICTNFSINPYSYLLLELITNSLKSLNLVLNSFKILFAITINATPLKKGILKKRENIKPKVGINIKLKAIFNIFSICSFKTNKIAKQNNNSNFKTLSIFTFILK